jgi:ribonuclease P/MRP protein subunit RPP1
MPRFYDLCIQNKSEEVTSKMEELGWETPEIETVFLEADDWGELKRKIGENREKADVLVFRGGDEKLNRKAVEDSRMDVLLHPEKGRKDSGFNHVLAKEASKNQVALGLDFKMLDTSNKTRSHIFRHWQRNLMLCEKYDAPYIITSSAKEKYDLRAPRDLASVIDSLGYKGKKAVSEYPKNIVERGETE